jgi:hypothetical protein
VATGRDNFLVQPDEKLLSECAVETYRASGPGGQHRNKTESAVRLTHRPTGVVVTATERRSQHENRHRALARLRKAIALQVREPIGTFPVTPVALVPGGMVTLLRDHASCYQDEAWPREQRGHATPPAKGAVPSPALAAALADRAWPRISPKSAAYLPAAAAILDHLEAAQGKISDVAERLGASTASLVKFLSLDADLWQAANRIRQRFGQKPLRQG